MYIRIEVLLCIHLCWYIAIRGEILYLFKVNRVYTIPIVFYALFIYLFILSLFSTSLSIRMKVIYRLLFCKSSAARKYGKYQSLIDRKLCMTLRNRRLRFPENFSDQLFALLSLCGGSYTLHIKGSR